jgi:biopolymer transport protein TolR
MQVGGSGSVKSEINVTPLVDVVLVLLIIFMVITPVVQMGYLVRVPEKPKGVTLPNPDQIVIRLLPEGRVMINKEVLTLDTYPNRIREILKGNSGKMVFFAGDPEVSYDDTLKFLDLTKASGAPNIGLIVEELQ